ncbi:hypothetical protein CCB80_05495 [Armatimonadetes bacterium Uphvl-Ar1]|nr:hypothetical protein CCB80_05495 [Armatimonadetes bacterium Uphvl-Ar1]
MRKRGFTFIELIIAMTMTLLLIGSIATAYQITVDYSRKTPERLNAFQDQIQNRRTLESLMEGTYVSDDNDDRLTYFVAANATGQSTTADSLTFTTLSRRIDGGFLLDQDSTFEDLNDRFGPQGGLSEVSLNIQSVGDPGDDRAGLFLRIQTPADGDPTQGGTERLLFPNVTNVIYEFWDGAQWVDAWDTVNGGSRRIPPAVRLTLEREEEEPEYLTFRIPTSDVTAENPITQESTGGTGP